MTTLHPNLSEYLSAQFAIRYPHSDKVEVIERDETISVTIYHPFRPKFGIFGSKPSWLREEHWEQYFDFLLTSLRQTVDGG